MDFEPVKINVESVGLLKAMLVIWRGLKEIYVLYLSKNAEKCNIMLWINCSESSFPVQPLTV